MVITFTGHSHMVEIWERVYTWLRLFVKMPQFHQMNNSKKYSPQINFSFFCFRFYAVLLCFLEWTIFNFSCNFSNFFWTIYPFYNKKVAKLHFFPEITFFRESKFVSRNNEQLLIKVCFHCSHKIANIFAGFCAEQPSNGRGLSRFAEFTIR